MSVAALEKWDRVLTRLWHTSRFTSYFYQSVRLVPTTTIPTLALIVSAHRFSLVFQPAFVLETSDDQLLALLLHEMLHVVLNHHHRAAPGNDPFLQNLAQDMVVNSCLEEQKGLFFSPRAGVRPEPVILPPGLPRVPRQCLAETGRETTRTRIADLTWEQVYAWLMRKKQQEDIFALDGPVGPTDPSTLPGQANTSWQNAETGRVRHGLAFTDNSTGNHLPTGMHLFEETNWENSRTTCRNRVLRFIQGREDCREERIFQEFASLIDEPRPVRNPPWKARLKSLVHQSAPASRWEYSFTRFNRRFFPQGIYAPGRHYRERPLITVAVDVSGSMTAHPQELETAFGAIEELLNDFRVSLVCIDQDVFVPRKENDCFVKSDSRRPCFYQKGDWRFIRTGSRGTTFFAPLFNQYMPGHKEMLLVITDGYIYDLEQIRPHTPTLWAISSGRAGDFNPPFGTAVPIKSAS